MHWTSGDQIVIRGRIGMRAVVVVPAIVVADRKENLILFIAPGTPCKRLVPAEGVTLPRVLSMTQIEDPTLRLIDSEWSETFVLHLTPTNAAYSVYARWSASDWTFRDWYVNLQSPITRFANAIDVEDRFLDIVVSPDLFWHWKDEDELVEAVSMGRLSAEQADTIRAVGEGVILDIQSRCWPFVPEIVAWRPDPVWPIPTLPVDWENA